MSATPDSQFRQPQTYHFDNPQLAISTTSQLVISTPVNLGLSHFMEIGGEISEMKMMPHLRLKDCLQMRPE